jgi:hypothetical protein
MTDADTILRGLIDARHDVGEWAAPETVTAASVALLGGKTHALVQMGALIAIGGAPAVFVEVTNAARRAGATVDEIVGTLIAVVPLVGVARVVSAAPALGLAVGYDVDEALETLDSAPPYDPAHDITTSP